MDWESIAAGLLHDTVEDTNVVTFERIEKEFGATVRRIVEGETKVLDFFTHISVNLVVSLLQLCFGILLNRCPSLVNCSAKIPLVQYRM